MYAGMSGRAMTAEDLELGAGGRFVVTADGAEAARREGAVRRGVLPAGKPYLNPLGRGGSASAV